MQFKTLGPLTVLDSDGTSVGFAGSLGRALVARLLMADGRFVDRHTLIDDLWGGQTAKNPVNALQTQVARLRTSFARRGDATRVETLGGGYRIVLSERDRLDVTEFEEAVRLGQERLRRRDHGRAEELLRGGLALWRGRAFEDLTGGFFEAERARLEELRLTAAEDAAAAGLEQGRAGQLVPELTGLLAAHPLRDKLRGQLMVALHQSGRRTDALEVFDDGARILDAELGLTPSPELTALRTAIGSQDRYLPGERRTTSRTTHPTPAGNLVRPVGAFVGRRPMVRSLRQRTGGERLLTVVGPGGVGKTRLLLEALADLGHDVDGVWWIDLATVGKDGVLAALVTALGLSESAVAAGQQPLGPLQRTVSCLAERKAVLAFDNCEHLVEEVAPLIRDLLDACPSLTVVTTSREPLGVAGEALFPVDPMSAEEAAELFALRASMLDPSCDREEAARSDDVLALCRRLDGLPLAVELAAAHTRVLSVPEIVRRLDDRFSLLVKGERTAPARHRTLRAVLDWSYALLSASEQLVLGELALRVAGCSLEDAERTGLAGPGETGPAETLRLLGQLVDKSLLFTVRTSGGGTRFRMLETVREYALARLAADGGLAAAEERFVAWSSGFVRKGHKGMPSGEQAWWSRRVSEESANLRAASELMIRAGRAGRALVLESTLGYFWYILGREEEGIDRLTRTLDAYDTERQRADPGRPSAEEEWALCYVLVWLAWLNHVCGRHATALRYERRHTDTWRTARNPDVAVVGPVWEALHARLSAEEGWAERFAAADASVAGTQFGWDRVALHYAWSTYCLHTGDIDGAREHALTGIEVSKDIDDPITLAVCLTARGDAEESAGRREAAGELWCEAADVLRSRGARSRWAYRALRLAFLDVGEGRTESADLRLAEVETIAADLVSYDLRAAVANLRGLALAGQSRLDEAGRLFREVWSSRTAPRSRRAVAGIGLASCAPSGRVLDAVGELLDGLADPPTRGAVGLLLAEARLPGPAPRGYVLHERLARSPSVLGAFC